MFKGSMPALVTPFSNGKVDIDALKKLVDWHVDQGSHGLVPVGATGESPTLTHAEHDLVVQTVVQAAAGRIPVIAGAGSNNTIETVRLVQAAKAAGADAALVVTPYCGLPIIIYNIPSRSVVDMTPETMGALAKLPMIIGVKDATGDLSRVPKQRMHCGTDFVQLSGEDATALGFNAHGGVGCISVTANIAAKLCAEFQETTLAGDYASALTQLDRLMPLHEAVFLEPGLVGAKYGMSLLGLCSDEVRSPLTTLTDETKAAIKSGMQVAGLLV